MGVKADDLDAGGGSGSEGPDRSHLSASTRFDGGVGLDGLGDARSRDRLTGDVTDGGRDALHSDTTANGSRFSLGERRVGLV